MTPSELYLKLRPFLRVATLRGSEWRSGCDKCRRRRYWERELNIGHGTLSNGYIQKRIEENAHRYCTVGYVDCTPDYLWGGYHGRLVWCPDEPTNADERIGHGRPSYAQFCAYYDLDPKEGIEHDSSARMAGTDYSVCHVFKYL